LRKLYRAEEENRRKNSTEGQGKKEHKPAQHQNQTPEFVCRKSAGNRWILSRETSRDETKVKGCPRSPDKWTALSLGPVKLFGI